MFFVRFTRHCTRPIEVTPDTPEDEIETREVAKEDTFTKRGQRFHDMACGHGEVLRLPVETRFVQTADNFDPTKTCGLCGAPLNERGDYVRRFDRT